MANLQQLAGSIAAFHDSTKQRAQDIPVKVSEQLSVMMEGLSQELDQHVIELGIPNGGQFNVAITERLVAMDDNTVNAAEANHFTKVLSGNTTLAISGAIASGQANVFLLHLINGGAFTVQWWPGINWSGGVVPVPTPNARDVYSFSTMDGGVTWDGYIVGTDLRSAV